jgi:hypothetical protein
MAKEKATTEEANKPETIEAETKETKVSPLAEIVKAIAALPQTDRLVLYSRLDVIMNHDREKASAGADGGTHLFDEAIKSL